MPLSKLEFEARARGARDKPSEFGDSQFFANIRAKLSALKFFGENWRLVWRQSWLTHDRVNPKFGDAIGDESG